MSLDTRGKTNLRVVAEIGVNHEGDLEKARDMIISMRSSDVDAIKLQSFTPSKYLSREDKQRFARVERFALSEHQHDVLFETAYDIGIPMFSTAVTPDWLPYLRTKTDYIKIASGDLAFEPLVREAARLFPHVILSTGASTTAEVDESVGWIRDESAGHEANTLTLLHCVSSYPAPIESANLLSIPFLEQRYALPVGFSSHFRETEVLFGAVAVGACLIEVHVTDKSEGREFRDHALSIEVHTLPRLIRKLRQMSLARGRQAKYLQECELEFRKSSRRRAVAARDLVRDQTLSVSDVDWVRHEKGICFEEAGLIIGQRLRLDVQRGCLILAENVHSERGSTGIPS